MEQFTEILREATAAVPAEYFVLPIHGGDPVYRERVYCYELYHQLRRLWPAASAYRLNGEVDKRSHPYFDDGLQPKPDFIVHRPGTADNYAVIEVKSHNAIAREIDKDLRTLALFAAHVGYRRRIYLIFGEGVAGCRDRIHGRAELFREMPPFELWLHPTVGISAEITY